jgi:hypothetical protein
VGNVDQPLFFFITSRVFSISSGGLLVAWLSARAKRTETYLAEALRQDQTTRAPIDEHLAGKIDVPRSEIERLADGNRVVTRVLSELIAPPDARDRVASARVNTPH